MPDPAVPSRGQLAFYLLRADGAAPLDQARRLGFSVVPGMARIVLPGEQSPRPAQQPAAVVALQDCLATLLEVETRALPSYRQPPVSLQVFAMAARLGTQMVIVHQLIPTLRGADGQTTGGWRAVLTAGSEWYTAAVELASAMPPAAHAIQLDDAHVWYPFRLLHSFLDGVVDALVRSANPPTASQRPRARLLPWTARWREACADTVDASVPLGSEEQEIAAAVAEWLRPLDRPAVAPVPELVLHAPESAESPWVVAFAMRTEDGERVTSEAVWQHSDGSGQELSEALLEALARAARLFPPLDAALSEARPTQAVIGTADAWRFVDEAAPLLTDAGYVVVLPHLKHLRLRIQVGSLSGGGADAQLAREPLPDAGGAVRYEWQVAIGDEILDGDELRRLAGLHEPLVRWRGRWVSVDPGLIGTLPAQRLGGELPLVEALGMALAGTTTGNERLHAPGTEVVAVGRLAQLIERIRAAERRAPQLDLRAFRGSLRSYQRRAVAWLGGMGALGLGSVLADDMGLGKTVMLIAHLLNRAADGPHLVICPTSVVTNWQRELQRFAPTLAVHRHHGLDRHADLAGVRGVVVTSYGTLRRDIDLLADVDWDVVALDEAQQVKNPDTLGARAVRRLRAAQRVALTGTPLENRLGELWSLMDAVNPGLLGPRSRFEQRYAVPIERRGDRSVGQRLRSLIAPFIMRRTKTDPEVAPDLPPKIERTVTCGLTAEQIERYAAAVDRFSGGREHELTPMQRRGRVLALITELKQICDHPALTGSGTDEHRTLAVTSGKLALTREIVTEALSGGEQVVVFTQFVGMARILAQQLERDLGTEVPVLHGGLPPAGRQRIVDAFQGVADEPAPPVLVASLRAGGVGLNLTAATQVIHYDRWWNPAVEEQASDRAHRIGQRHRVMVHRLVTAGTIEERIARMLEEKRELASLVVGAGEAWITELDDDELLELVRLGEPAALDEPELLEA